MAKKILIKQNPQRYTQRDNEWVISASPSVTPLTIKKGVVVSNLKPLLNVDSIIVKVGDWYLCSKQTVEVLKSSANPHYSIQANGPISVRGKSVNIGKSVKIIEVNIASLKKTGDDLDFQNRKAAVAYVDYIYEGDTQDGVPINLIKQINYTLNPDISRPEDKFGLHSLSLGDDTTVYSIDKLNTETKQADGTLDKGKLETFLKNLQSRLVVLRNDFNMIKDVFYNGTLPDSQVTIDFQKVANSGVANGPIEEPPVVFKYTTLAKVVEAPISTPASGSTTTPTTEGTQPPAGGTPAQPASSPIIQLKMRKQTGLKRNSIPVWTNDPTTGDKGKRKKLIREGDIFWGYFLKDAPRNHKIWAVYESDKTTLIGYGDADSNDFVDTV